MLLLHGVHGTAESWEGLIQALNGALPAIAIDQRGHGESSWPEDGYDVVGVPERGFVARGPVLEQAGEGS